MLTKCYRKAWDLIFSDPHLSLNSLRQRAIAGSVCQNGLRSVCWKVNNNKKKRRIISPTEIYVKIFLGYLPSLEFSTWSSLLLKERQRYIDLKRKYIDEPTEKMKTKGEQDLSSNNPLALSDTVNSKNDTCIVYTHSIFRIHGNSSLLILKLKKLSVKT